MAPRTAARAAAVWTVGCGGLRLGLLESPGHASHMFNYWAELLRVKTRLNNNISGEPFVHYLKDSIANNKRYDEFVRENLAGWLA